MHGSYANKSEFQRRAVVLNTMADGTLSNRNEDNRSDLLNGFPIIPHGEPMKGQYFPLLFDAKKELGDLASEFSIITDFE
jgi:hypothetical protein